MVKNHNNNNQQSTVSMSINFPNPHQTAPISPKNHRRPTPILLQKKPSVCAKCFKKSCLQWILAIPDPWSHPRMSKKTTTFFWGCGLLVDKFWGDTNRQKMKIMLILDDKDKYIICKTNMMLQRKVNHLGFLRTC